MSTKLPSPIEMQLLAIVARERTGREAAQEYERLTGEEMSYGTL